MKQHVRTSVLIALIATACAISLFAQNQKPEDPYKAVNDRLQAMSVVPLPDWRAHDDTLPHAEDPSLNDADWQTAQQEWTSGPRWFRREVEIPKLAGGHDITGSRVRFDLHVTSDEAIKVRVFFNGNMVSDTDEDTQQPILITQNAQPGQKLLVAISVVGQNVKTKIERAVLLIDSRDGSLDPGMLRDEILSAEPLIAAFPDSREQHQQQVDAAVKAIDLAALDRGDQAGFNRSMDAAQAALKPIGDWEKTFSIRATGNTHIDMAWLWPWTETVEVVRDTFTSALQLMRQYPDFTFTMSTAQTYSWMEEKYPALFKQVQERVKEGRWEVIGGMWVEPDLNLPSGESLVRQILVGKRYFQQKFGVDIKVGWNPDSFGYNWQLPQIYKKSGMDYFVTQKIYWNDTTKFPYKLFWWESPDGTRILTYFPHDYVNFLEPVRMASDLAMYAPAMGYPEMMHLYGVGDHGGGPTRTMIDRAHRWEQPNAIFPKIFFGKAKDYFDGINQALPKLNVPVWKDELYFEYHRGVQTTQAETKRRIRRDEEAMLNAEKASSIAMLWGRPYPQQQLNDAWKKVLFDQFHDIMPGSGIAVNYLDAQRDLDDAYRVADDAAVGALNDIASHINTAGQGVPVVVFNPLSWKRTDVVETEVEFPGGGSVKNVEARDSAGKPWLAEVIGSEPGSSAVRVRLIGDVPAMGYTVLHLTPVAKGLHLHVEIPHEPAALSASDSGMANAIVSIKIDPKTGCMTSLFDKRSNKEALAPAETDSGGPHDMVCGNLLQTFVDKPKNWDAWNIDADFEKTKWDLTTPEEVKLVENTPTRAVIRVRNKFQNSEFTRDITMYPGIPRVDVRMHASWHEKHILLKVAFPLSAHNDKATFEIPYGSIERPTTRNTPREKAMFEVPALHWGDLSDAQHGFSLLNNCKYGYDAKGNVLRLSLLRSPEWPDPHADEGEHDFTYSLYPHGGGWREAGTVDRGFELNYPLVAMQVPAHAGELPAEHSFVTVGADNVVLTAVKKSEDDDALILRFYEWAGKKGEVKLSLPMAATRAAETNLMEKEEHDLSLGADRRTVSVETGPYEIKTVKVWMK